VGYINSKLSKFSLKLMMQVGQLWFHLHLPNKDKQIVNVTDKFLCEMITGQQQP